MDEARKAALRKRQADCKIIANLFKEKYPNINGTSVHQYFYNEIKNIDGGNFLSELLFICVGPARDDKEAKSILINSIEQLPGFKKYLESEQRKIIINNEEEEYVRGLLSQEERPSKIKRSKEVVDLKIGLWFLDKMGGDGDYALRVLKAAIAARNKLKLNNDNEDDDD